MCNNYVALTGGGEVKGCVTECSHVKSNDQICYKGGGGGGVKKIPKKC